MTRCARRYLVRREPSARGPVPGRQPRYQASPRRWRSGSAWRASARYVFDNEATLERSPASAPASPWPASRFGVAHRHPHKATSSTCWRKLAKVARPGIELYRRRCSSAKCGNRNVNLRHAALNQGLPGVAAVVKVTPPIVPAKRTHTAFCPFLLLPCPCSPRLPLLVAGAIPLGPIWILTSAARDRQRLHGESTSGKVRRSTSAPWSNSARRAGELTAGRREVGRDEQALPEASMT